LFHVIFAVETTGGNHMQQEITPKKNLETLSRYIINAYSSAPIKEKGIIQLRLQHQGEHIPCYFLSNGKEMTFNFGEVDNYDVKLITDLYDWLDLANDKLNPVWGILTKRLKFEGDTKVFDKLIKKELIYKIQADTFDPPTSFEIDPFRNWKKPEKILVINGSPRGQNGYTFHYLNRFIKGLKAGGAAVETIELGQKKVNPCLGCFHCWKNDTGRCVQNDDANDLYNSYEDSDLVVFAFTLYWDTVPGILKNFIERAICLEYPYMIPGLYKTRHPRRKKRDKSFFVFSVCGFPEQAHFDSVKQYFKDVGHNAHSPLLGGIYRSACMFLHNDPGYYKTYNLVLDSLQKAGKSLYKSGRIDKQTINAIQTKIDPEEFRLQSNKFWENVVLQKEWPC
jgi:multimeric flavodoxin WrbA/putative sterol carrier protein